MSFLYCFVLSVSSWLPEIKAIASYSVGGVAFSQEFAEGAQNSPQGILRTLDAEKTRRQTNQFRNEEV